MMLEKLLELVKTKSANKTYEMVVTCMNCRQRGTVSVPFGQKFSPNNHPCPNCGVRNLYT